MAIVYNSSIVRDGLTFYFDAANSNSRLGSNLLTGLTSVSNFPANQNVTVTQLSRGEIQAVTNQTTSSPGVWPIGGIISVSANTQYTLRVNGTVISGSAPFLYVTGTTTGDIVWTGNPLTTSGGYVENTFNTGSNTSVRVGVLWNSPTLGSTFIISNIGLFRTDRWYDINGTSNNGTLTNGPAFSSTNNGYFTFDGVDDYVSIANSTTLQVADTFTISAWIYPTTLSARHGIFSTRVSNTTGCWQLEVGTGSSGSGRVVVTGIGTWMWESNNNVITTNTWYNICFVKPNNATVGGTMYLNGTSISPSVTTAYTIQNNSDSKIIGFGTASAQYFGGRISLVTLYNRALNAAEVTRNFEAIRGRYGI